MPAARTSLGIAAGVVVAVLAAGGVAVALAVDGLPPGTTLAGQPVSDPEDAALAAQELSARLAALPVVLATDAGEVEVSAGSLGASVDERGVIRAAEAGTGVDGWLERYTGGTPVSLPVALFFTTGEAEEVADRLSTAPVDGAVEVTAAGLEVTEPVVGVEVTGAAVARAFRAAASTLEGTAVADWPPALRVDVEAEVTPPTITQRSIDTLLERVEQLTGDGFALQAQAVPEDSQTVEGVGVPARETITLDLTPPELVQLLAVAEAPGEIERDRLTLVPTDARVPPALERFLLRAEIGPEVALSIEDRSPPPSRVPAEQQSGGSGGPADQAAYGDADAVSGRIAVEVIEPGLEPSLPDTIAGILDALEAGDATGTVQGEPVTEADPADLGILEPVSTWTTFYEPGQGRVTNIHRIAERLDGTLVPPGGNLEINHAVGPRTEAEGYVAAGAILEGEFITDVGGGVSQFATTFFNAMWFAGLDIITHTPHSFWFDRYPAGREATIDFPGVDLEFNNNTPHWVLVDTSVTADSVTVTFWSTPHFEVDTTTGPRETTSEGFRIRVARTSTAPDGTVDDDSFLVDYRLP